MAERRPFLNPGTASRPAAQGPGIERVTLCLDRSEFGERALPHALLAARAFDAPLSLLHVLDTPAGQKSWDACEWEILRSESHAYLDRVRGIAGGERVDVSLVEGKVEDQILHEIGIGCSQLLILSTHGEHGLHGWHMGCTARQLLAAAPCSLLLVPAWLEPPPQDRGYARILVPLDGSARAECALPVAVRMARACGAEIILLHVVPGAPLTQAETSLPEDRDIAHALDERNAAVARRYLERAKRSCAGQVKVRTLLRRGADVRDVLLDLPREDAVDLIVMSAHGQTGSDARPYGSAALHLIDHGATPLLIVQDLSAETRVRLAKAFRERRQPARQASLFHDSVR
jgi:nucleotide-binding universal stress UspA family protein